MPELCSGDTFKLLGNRWVLLGLAFMVCEVDLEQDST